MGIEVAGAAEMGRETVQLVRELQPDVVIMDISLPDLNGSRQPGKYLRKNRMLNNCLCRCIQTNGLLKACLRRISRGYQESF